MVQLKVAVVDREREYLEQLLAYLVRKKECFFKVWIFWDTQMYQRAADSEKFDAILVTGECLEELDLQMLQTKIILFREDGIPGFASHLPAVSKYQSAEEIFSQISALLWQENPSRQEWIPGRRTKMVGVYSPVHHGSQMLFSLTMAGILGEQQKVLYLNLQENSGFYGVTDSCAREDIGDLIYGMMQKDHDFQAGLHRIRRTFLNFDYIPPAVNPEHLSEIPQNLYEELFIGLKNTSGYDVVIVDFGMAFLGFAQILPIFETVYCLGKEGYLNRFRMEEFLGYLNKESDAIASQLKNVVMPEGILLGEESCTLEKCLYGSLGDYVRSCLGGQEIE
ncbi:MAG: hypothetical protein NC307_09155 [Roseburia sp.]|nr:hypothetical protein [Roseburia sp.]